MKRALKWMALATGVTTLGVPLTSGCSKFSAKGPNTSAAEDKLLYDLGQALVTNNKAEGLAFYDLEVRQKLELWDKTLRLAKTPEAQLEAYEAARPRIADQAALVSVGDEAWDEAKGQPWAQELADGKCVSGPPEKTDVGKGIMPKENQKMEQDVGLFIFELRTAVNWTPAFRVHCPSGGTFWIQLAQRKKVDPTKEQPIKVVRVTK